MNAFCIMSLYGSFFVNVWYAFIIIIIIKIYRTIILPVVLYGHETWAVTLREEPRLGVFENRVLRRIFGPKRDNVKGEWKKLHNDELKVLQSSSNVVRMIKSGRMRWAWQVAHMGEGRVVFWWRDLRERDPWGDPGVNRKIILRWIFRKWNMGGMDWIELAQDKDRWRALVNVVMNLWVP